MPGLSKFAEEAARGRVELANHLQDQITRLTDVAKAVRSNKAMNMVAVSSLIGRLNALCAEAEKIAATVTQPGAEPTKPTRPTIPLDEQESEIERYAEAHAGQFARHGLTPAKVLAGY